MGFLTRFLGVVVANNISERKEMEKERQRAVKQAINQTQKLLDIQLKFIRYLESINCRNANYDDIVCHIVNEDDIDNDRVSSYDIVQIEAVHDKYKRLLKEFMRIGGNPIYITDLRNIELYIEIVQRLKEYGWLDRQEKYVKYADDTYWLDSDWREEEKKRNWLSILLSLPSNELNHILNKDCIGFIPYNDGVEKEAIYLNDAYFAPYLHDDSYIGNGGGAWDAPISIKLTDKYIIFYNNDYLNNIHDEIYYKSTIENCSVEILGTPFTTNWAGTIINSVHVIFKMDELNRVQQFYENHNNRVKNENIIACENINSLSGIEFENVCKRLLESMGFSVETTKTSGDGGIDLIAHNTQPLLSGKYIIQCKRYTGSVGEPILRDLYGVITAERANKGILMTTGHFTKQAIHFAEDKPIELIDGVKLNKLIETYAK